MPIKEQMQRNGLKNEYYKNMFQDLYESASEDIDFELKVREKTIFDEGY